MRYYMGKNIKILVICHKKDKHIRASYPYMPIQVGADLYHDLDLGFQKDNDGDNISSRNASWCELTGIYWGWKNIKDVDYIGICHYRRYFEMDMSENNIEKYLRKYDMIVADGGKMIDRTSRAKNLIHMTSQEDAYIFIDTLLTMYPEFSDERVRKYIMTIANLFSQFFLR